MTQGYEEICNTDDVLDSRDIIKRIAFLRSARDDLEAEVNTAQGNFERSRTLLDNAEGEVEAAAKELEIASAAGADEESIDLLQVALDDAEGEAEQLKSEYDENEATLEAAQGALDEFPEQDELSALEKLESDCSGASDWQYGVTLIHADHFTQYAEELAEDVCSYDSSKVRWPFTCIDWEKAAQELKQDYFEVDFDGETYYARN